MSESAHPLLPQTTGPTPVRPEVALTLIHSPQPLGYFEHGLQQPVSSPASLTSRELQTMRRLQGYEVSQHVVASTVLRCAGLQTSIMDFEAYRTALSKQKQLRNTKQVTRANRAQADTQVAETEKIAQPYIEVLGDLQPHIIGYHALVASEAFDATTVRQNVMKLHDATTTTYHPGITLIREARGVIGDQAIKADRIFRIALLGYGGKTIAEILS